MKQQLQGLYYDKLMQVINSDTLLCWDNSEDGRAIVIGEHLLLKIINASISNSNQFILDADLKTEQHNIQANGDGRAQGYDLY